MRVFGWKTLMRNESKGGLSSEVGNLHGWHYRPIVRLRKI